MGDIPRRLLMDGVWITETPEVIAVFTGEELGAKNVVLWFCGEVLPFLSLKRNIHQWY